MSHSDDELMDALAAFLRAERPAERAALREQAIGAYAWRTIDEDLAELVFDSTLEQPAGARSQGGRRELTYRAPGLEIEVVIDGESRTIVGQLVPAARLTVTLAGESMSTDVVADELGRFLFEDVGPGPFSLSVQTGDESSIQTDWSIF